MSHTAVFTLLGIHSTKAEFLFWMFNICSSTSFMDILPLKTVATVRYLPCLGSQAAIMFLASNICWVSSGTERGLYCWLPRAVRGAKPGMKKWSLGKGPMFTANFLRSAFSWPGNLRQVVTPDMVSETRWFRSPYVGDVSFKVLKQMSYRASLSMQKVSSVFSTNWWTDRVAL